ncbi:MAG: hypothetical protein K9G71_19980, partial [Rhodobacteraceae bacterium]|nr:hypothetical protein [Paracoccaceae bacterium]MCF8521007.1 hypothetical protein [Paracoccaceae bacterium]
AVCFHIGDFGLGGASASQVCDQFSRQDGPCGADQNAGPVFTVTTIATVDDSEVGAPDGQDFHLL